MVDSAMSKMQKGKQPEGKVSKAVGIPYSTAEKMQKSKQPKRKIKIKDMPGSNEVMSLLTKKQKTLPEGLKKKIIESKKSGAGYSGD